MKHKPPLYRTVRISNYTHKRLTEVGTMARNNPDLAKTIESDDDVIRIALWHLRREIEERQQLNNPFK